MGKMVKDVIGWFVVFGLSFLIQKLGWMEQGKAFLCINLITFVLIMVVSIIIAGAGQRASVMAGVSAITLISSIIVLGISLLATWGASELFDIDFYIVYQIISFGKCLVAQIEIDK